MKDKDYSNCKTLKEFYDDYYQFQVECQGVEYLGYHDFIFEKSKNKRVKELGVAQGGTLAAFTLANPKSVIGVDINEPRFAPQRYLFNNYCNENNIEFDFKNVSSLSQDSVSLTDILMIDTRHTGTQLLAELRLHAPHVSEYIIMDDTNKPTGMLGAINLYMNETEDWVKFYQENKNVGYVILERK